MAEMRGLKELLQNLKELDRNVNTEARIAVAAGANLVKKEAVKNARAHKLADTGALINNIAIKREKGVPKGVYEYHVGVRRGNAKNAPRIPVLGKDGKTKFQWMNNPFYWWFWEFGHFNEWSKRHVAAKPFIRPAMASKQGEVLGVMKMRLAARLQRFTKKALS